MKNTVSESLFALLDTISLNRKARRKFEIQSQIVLLSRTVSMLLLLSSTVLCKCLEPLLIFLYFAGKMGKRQSDVLKCANIKGNTA